MAMVVKNNMTAVNTLNILNKNSSALSKSLQKVSSGMKINSAADDASGYAISERMRVQIRSLDQANQNTQNGSSMMKVAEGAVSSTVEILKTLKEKAVNAANDSNTDSDRLTIQKELDQSIDQINDNANVTFNGKYLVDGSKNTLGKATYTALSNQSLSEDTKADTKLTNLAARSGDSLEIHDTDKITVSYVQGGKTYSTTFQVGDKALQDIFAAAEDTDKDSQIFATNDNEAVKAAGGAQGISSASAEAKAIDYLKSQLADGTANGATKDDNAFTSEHGGAIDLHTAVVPAAGQGQFASAGYADTNGDDYKAGDLYNAVVDADKELKKAEDKLGEYTAGGATNSGLAKDLGERLEKAGISWDGNAATLNTSDMVAKLETAYAEPTNDGLKEAVAAYKDGVANVDKATAALDEAVENYTTAQEQLNALTIQQGINEKVEQANVLRTALESIVFSKIDTATGQLKYIDGNSITKIDGTNGDIYVNGTKATDGTDHGAAAPSAEDKEAAKASFSAALDKVFAAGMDANNSKAAIKTLVSKFTIGGTAIATDDPTGLGGALGDVKTEKAKITASVADDLKDAQEKVVSKFTAPALMTGSNVGVNAADEVVTTASGRNAITITANAAGIGGQISGLNISVSDAQGNVKKSANAALDAFEETVRAQNKSDDNAISLQVGAKANQSIKIGLTDMRAEALGLQGADGTKLNISTQDKANAAINVLDNAIQKALDQQTTIGSVESRLEYTSSNLTTASENVQASESTIRDADMAKEMTEYTKNNVLLQAAQSMLAQANQSSSNVLSLLQ